jgi:hypothetical protein
MAKLSRAIQKIFGSTGGTTDFGQIGSKSAGSAVNSKDITTIQALSRYLQGLSGILVDNGTSLLPYLQDINSLFYLCTSQLTYLFQNGIPEWLNSSDQNYYANVSIVTRSGGIYMAILGDDATNLNVQKDPLTEPTWWSLIWQKPAVVAWDTAESSDYEDPGVVVDRNGTHYTSTGKTGNSGKDPELDVNSDYWLASPGFERLDYLARNAEPVPAGMHVSHNLGDSDYQTSLLLDKKTVRGTTYEYYLVHLDGSTVTGNSVLENIFGTTGTSYSKIDIYAPIDTSIRTLVDMRGRTTRSMTTGGSVADTLGELQEDAMQRITGSLGSMRTRDDLNVGGVFSTDNIIQAPEVSSALGGGSDIEFDSANSTYPNTAKTDDVETRMKNIVKGIDYIIVKKVAA